MSDIAPPADESAPLAAAYAHCETAVREGERDRYLASLFAPGASRRHLFALYAFGLEIARVRDVARQPIAGEIRLQWWRDALGGEARGDAVGHPVAAALLDTIERFHLPRQALVDLIDARAFDLYDDPMQTIGDLEGYCGETSSALIRLASLVLADGADPGAADAAGHAGVAYAITGLLRAFPWHASRGQVYAPADLLERHGVAREDIVAGRNTPALRSALAEMRRLAAAHHERFAALLPTVAALIAPAFLPAMLTPLYIARMERGDYDPFHSPIEVPQWRRQWALWRTARRFSGPNRSRIP